MRAVVVTTLLIVFDQGVRQLALQRHWPIASGAHLIHFSGQSLIVIIVTIIICLLQRKRGLILVSPLLAGTVSNYISSLEPFGIIDYIPFGPFYSNSADLMITGGAIWLIQRLLKR